MSVQRLRVRFCKRERVRHISHLDVLRFWERAIRRAGLPLSYSQGFTPHPKIAFASPLPLGFTSEAEIMDVTLDERVALAEFQRLVAAETTADLGVVDVTEVPATAAPPQSLVRWADYQVDLPGIPASVARESVSEFMACVEFPWVEEKKEKTRRYDLRASVGSLIAGAVNGGTRLNMRLQADQEMTARPEQILAALFPGATFGVIVRTGFVLDERSPAREAWRRRGQFET